MCLYLKVLRKIRCIRFWNTLYYLILVSEHTINDLDWRFVKAVISVFLCHLETDIQIIFQTSSPLYATHSHFERAITFLKLSRKLKQLFYQLKCPSSGEQNVYGKLLQCFR